MLFGNVRFRDVGGDLRYLGAVISGHLEIVFGADTGQKQHGKLAILDHLGRRLNELHFGLFRESVGNGRAPQAVAMGDFDHLHSCVVQAARHAADLRRGILMT